MLYLLRKWIVLAVQRAVSDVYWRKEKFSQGQKRDEVTYMTSCRGECIWRDVNVIKGVWPSMAPICLKVNVSQTRPGIAVERPSSRYTSCPKSLVAVPLCALSYIPF